MFEVADILSHITLEEAQQIERCRKRGVLPPIDLPFDVRQTKKDFIRDVVNFKPQYAVCYFVLSEHALVLSTEAEIFLLCRELWACLSSM